MEVAPALTAPLSVVDVEVVGVGAATPEPTDASGPMAAEMNVAPLVGHAGAVTLPDILYWPYSGKVLRSFWPNMTCGLNRPTSSCSSLPVQGMNVVGVRGVPNTLSRAAPVAEREPHRSTTGLTTHLQAC